MKHETNSPKVSVCVITYNQEDFIGQCLQSIVDQHTDFDFEVVVGEDASTDGTRRIVQGFADRYPELIHPIYQERNIGGGSHNFRTVHLAARGMYVAHVDGDDFILPGKLQAQVDILDAKPDVSFAAHAVQIIGTNRVIGNDVKYPELGTIYDILRFGPYFTHSSVMYRRDEEILTNFPLDCIDYYMYIERAIRGSIFLDKEVRGCYRLHGTGISQSLTYTPRTERLYELAFDRAEALGVDSILVKSARLDRRMKFAIARCISGDNIGYRRLISINSSDWEFASKRHKILHVTRWFPVVVKIYFLVRHFDIFSILWKRSF